MEFEERKTRALDAMNAPEPDKSPKGTVDAPIVSLLDAINRHPCFFTTSSCSGRISIFSHLPKSHLAIAHGTDSVTKLSTSHDDSMEKNAGNDNVVAETKKTKKSKADGGSWLLVSHDPIEPEAVVDLLFGGGATSTFLTRGTLVFRFEPFILAVECRDATSAQLLVSTAIASGFRESGITNLSKRTIVAIRCSIRLEVPLGTIGEIMVSPEYVMYLVEIANEKMKQNRHRTDAFYQALTCEGALSSDVSSDKSNRRRKQDRKRILSTHQVTQCEEFLKDNTESRSFPQKIVSSGKINNSSLGRSSKKTSSDSEAMDLTDGRVVTVQSMTISGEPIEKLYLWGHSACALNVDKSDQVIIFGGFGGLGRHARRNDTLVFDPHTGLLRSVWTEGPPSPRLGHTSSVVGKHMFVIGGRGDPMQIFSDVWVLDMAEKRWMLMSCTGSIFPGRHRHAAAVLGSDIFVFGGLNNEMIHSTMYVLDSETMGWSEIEIQGERPCARHSHALVASDSTLFMFGGYDGQKALGDFYIFNVAESCWKNQETSGKAPSPRFSHSMFIYGNYIGIIGGCPLRQHHEVSLLHLEHYIWSYVLLDYVPRGLWVRCTVIIHGDDLVLVGGGASCYAFGAKFNQPIKTNIMSLLSRSESDCKSTGNSSLSSEDIFVSFARLWNTLSGPKQKRCQVNEPVDVACDIYSVNHAIDTQALIGEHECFQSGSAFLRLGKRYAKDVKDILKNFGWLDLSRKVVSDRDDLHVLLPVSSKFFEDAATLTERFKNCLDDCHLPKSITLKGAPINEISISGALDILLACRALIMSDNSSCSKRTFNSHQKNLKDAVCSLVNSRGLPPELMAEVPKRWDRLGDLLVFPVTSFKDPAWDLIGQDLLPIVANSLGTRRLARQGRVLPTGTRDSTLEILFGENGLVKHTENDIKYCFDATKCMFSFGNLSEKFRMGQLDCRDEVVVDLFAGIGYFVLPFLVRAKAKLVYACEWNPHAITALRRNLEINMVGDRCIVIEGDNRMMAPKGVADRVCLGLLPSSEESWLTAVRALRPSGGVLHIHGNVDNSAEKTWPEHVLQSVDRMAKEEGYCWRVSLQHVERVKWYGPRVRHLVVDVRCSLHSLID